MTQPQRNQTQVPSAPPLHMYVYFHKDLESFEYAHIEWVLLKANDDCTIIIPGMHKNIKEWAERLTTRGLDSEALVERMDDTHFTKEDKKHFKTDWTAQPCKKY
ncbi:hypothetical protein PV05_04393 [Exophiala xenobiotica]|uniref:Uncharacterized protein n=1 Tax=Exophiala xenobiotica TaxID=348802 RepID=A0A0D2CZT0_9EURO|nr:uncharacterized protein PV05_04393 [Exophiala xenobiotica]KIW55662.1 hypothetical protein PV05_04393 [Exophiala xenobiotica]